MKIIKKNHLLAELTTALVVRRQKMKTIALAFLSVLMASVIPNWAGATTIDLYQSFPAHQGDNGFFAYRTVYDSNTYNLLTETAPYYFAYPGTPWNNPQIFGDSHSWLGDPWIALIDSGTVGPAEDAVLAYVIPQTENIQINGSFYLYPQSLNGIYAYVLANNVPLWFSYVAPGAMLDFNIASLVLNAGDTIYFGTNANNNVYFSEYNDWPFLKGQILVSPLASVPEPETYLLMGVGLLGIFAVRKHTG